MMADPKKIRRIGTLCLNCICNIASYRAGWDGKKKLKVDSNFWTRVNGNFLDMATLDWCKLFLELSGKHHWSKIYSDKKKFRNDLFLSINMSEKDFDIEAMEIKKYRDKYLAHLDEPAKIYYPKTDIMLNSSFHLFRQLVNDPQTRIALSGALIDPQTFYDQFHKAASKEIRNAKLAHQNDHKKS